MMLKAKLQSNNDKPQYKSLSAKFSHGKSNTLVTEIEEESSASSAGYKELGDREQVLIGLGEGRIGQNIPFDFGGIMQPDLT